VCRRRVLRTCARAGLTTVERGGPDEVVVLVGVLLVVFFVLTGVLCEILYRRRILAPEVPCSIAAGICFGLSACSARCGMLISAAHGPAGMVSGVLLSIILTSFGFVAQTRGLKEGRAIVIVTYANLVALLVALLFGVLALSEPLPQSSTGIAGRLASLCLLGAGSFLLQDAGKRKGSGHGIAGVASEMQSRGFSSPFPARSANRSELAGAGHHMGHTDVMMDPVQVLTALDPKQV